MSQNNEQQENVSQIMAPPQHATMHLVDANETYLLASRASFKSSMGGGLFNLRRVFEMPRSTGVGVGISFNNLYENTVPPLKAFLMEKGFVEDVHFTICKPPPASWPKPYLGVVDKTYKNTMTWYNGTIKQFVSLRRKASANGVSAQWGDFDEVKFMDEKVLVDEIFPIFRGNEKHFKQCSGYLSKFFMTDKNADPAHIQWLLKKRELVDTKKRDIVLSLAIQLENLKAEYNKGSRSRKFELRPQIYAIETRLSILRSSLVNVVEISIDDVRPIFGEKFYADKKRNTPAHEFKVVYENKDPDRPGEPFYPSWNTDVHVYEKADDINPSLPFIISTDYQHSIAPIPIAQLSTLPGSARKSLNYVDEAYAMAPEGLRAAVKMFCSKYKNHERKEVYYIFDHTAVADRQEAEPYYKIVISELEANGWIVWPIYTGQAPDHYQKYVDTMDWMEESNEDCIPIRVASRCKKLKASITSAAAKIVNNKTKKDKSLETNKNVDQSTTTHFSDAFDMTNDAVLKRKMIDDQPSTLPFAFR